MSQLESGGRAPDYLESWRQLQTIRAELAELRTRLECLRAGRQEPQGLRSVIDPPTVGSYS